MSIYQIHKCIHRLAIVTLATYCLSIKIGFGAASASPRQSIPFDTGWRFYLADDQAFRQPNCDDTNWRTLDLPHDWSIEGEVNPPPEGERTGGYFHHGIGWYRKSFKLDPLANEKVAVEFDGIYMNSEAWINGHFLGRRPYGFIGFIYDLTEFLKTDGSTNVIAVRVDDSLEPSLRWYAGAGIYRHVRLITTSYTHFRLDGGITITTPEVSPKQAVVKAAYVIDAHFFNETERQAWLTDIWHPHPSKRDLFLRSWVEDLQGNAIAGVESKISLQNMHPGQQVSQQIKLPSPRLWSDRTPELYQLRSTLSLDGQTLDENVTTFGIRQIKFDSNHGLFVNGEPTKLKGVCLHQDAGSFGNAVPTAVWAWRLLQLKAVGCNAIRTSHHPFAPEFYDLCDRLGFYVFDEAFDEWTLDWPYNFTENPRGKSAYGYHLYFDQWHDTDLRAMLRRDRNHPSVILYSIGNEIPNQRDRDGAKIARELVSACHAEDPTRPVTSACDQSAEATRNGFMDALDLAGYNYICRLYGTNNYAPERKRFPHRICLGTETTYALDYWLGVRDHDYVIGDFIWSGFDYLGETGQLPKRGSSSGFLDLAGGRKPEFYQHAAYWRNDPVLQIAVLSGEKSESEWQPLPSAMKWNWPAGKMVTVRAIANCDEVELFLNHRSLGRHEISPDAYSSDWAVVYEPGEVYAVGYRDGKQVATQELRRTGEPVRLKITPQTLPIVSDVAIYEITVLNSTGLVVSDASPKVTVQVEGAGRLIGLDTGNLNYTGNFKTNTRDAYQGRLLATVQRTALSGEIRVLANSPGLTDSECQSIEKSVAKSPIPDSSDFPKYDDEIWLKEMP